MITTGPQSVESYLWRRAPVWHHFDGNLVGFRLLQRPAAGNWTKTFSPPVLQVDQAVVGANAAWMVPLDDASIDEGIGAGNRWHREIYRVGAFSGPAATAGASNTMVSGIQIGCPFSDGTILDTAPPWTDPGIIPYVRLGANLGTNKYYYEAAAGDGVTPTLRVELGDFVPGNTPFHELIYNPYLRKITALLQGRVVYEHTDLATLPRFGANADDGGYSHTGFGLYVESGSNAAADVTGYWIRAMSCAAFSLNYDGTGGAPMWYAEL